MRESLSWMEQFDFQQLATFVCIDRFGTRVFGWQVKVKSKSAVIKTSRLQFFNF